MILSDIKERYNQQQLASLWDRHFKDAMVAKAPYTKKWNDYWNAYNGDYFKNVAIPEYKSNMVSNYIFATVETIRPIMLDNNPKFQALPRQPEGLAFANDLQDVFNYEWDREKMMKKLCADLITTLVIGTSIYFLPWDSENKQIRAISVNPYNIFPDPLATSFEDAEYIIYASYKNERILQQKFPKYAELIRGGDIKYGELVNDNNKDARIDNQILVLEIYTRDYENEEYIVDGKKKWKAKYSNGRQLLICPELGLVLEDKEIPYNDGKFPFRILKDYDVPGKFWGEGEVAQLLSPQKHINELNNSIIDNAKATANMPWIIDKNSGVGQGKITNRPGLIIRKNPNTEVRREQPPSMPAYVSNAVEIYKNDIEHVSGVFNSLKGKSETGVYTAQGILALQEAGQARVRLKVKILEDALGDIAMMWLSRMKQFWKEDKWLQITRQDGSYDLKKFIKESLNYDYDIRITAGSTMPTNRGAMLDLMIRLAQTQMPDGQPLVDREAVVNYLPDEVRTTLLQRMNGENIQLQQMQQIIQQMQEQFQQVIKELQANDEQTISAIEDIVKAIDKLNQEILQLKNKHVTIETERKKEKEKEKIQSEAYNNGFIDAEKLYSEEDKINSEGSVENSGLPEEILSGLESLTDEELALLIKKNPELVELINNAE